MREANHQLLQAILQAIAIQQKVAVVIDQLIGDVNTFAQRPASHRMPAFRALLVAVLMLDQFSIVGDGEFALGGMQTLRAKLCAKFDGEFWVLPL
ncbi:MAG TPA: hypothetical protein VKU02_24255 [Gemmataceae bacterium]|nr:hypothetical protein [Gemmataceae bacterium]